MSLFKKAILDYYIPMNYSDDFILLHCSRNDKIIAPFDGNLEIVNNGCILSNKHFKLHISHIECEDNDDIKMGDVIGTPLIGKIDGDDIAYIGIKIYKDDKMQDAMLYLAFMDEDIIEAETKQEIKNTVEVQKKSTKKSKKKK